VSVAIVTGASRGLGLAMTRALVADGWHVIVDARHSGALTDAVSGLGERVAAIAGDVTDPDHRGELVEAARVRGGLDLLVNNASLLGPSPQPGLVDYPLDMLRRVFEVNLIAPLALAQLCLPLLESSSGSVVNITSDAAVEGYEGWGGYGSSKAALEQASAVLAAEHPRLGVYWVDPGDMNTQMQQEAFPGEDVSDRRDPSESVPGILGLVAGRPPSGRYRAVDLGAAP
jgi:NAD(P)-dependent dehydrogenase (short-subunit alcohol dehydrogenase family)